MQRLCSKALLVVKLKSLCKNHGDIFACYRPLIFQEIFLLQSFNLSFSKTIIREFPHIGVQINN